VNRGYPLNGGITVNTLWLTSCQSHDIRLKYNEAFLKQLVRWIENPGGNSGNLAKWIEMLNEHTM